MKPIEAMVRSLRDVAIWLVIYVIVMTASASLLMFPSSNQFINILIGISPVVPVAFLLRAIMQLLQQSDELQQRIQLMSIGFSAVTTGLGTMAYGMLEFNIGSDKFPLLPSAIILPLMLFLWVVGMMYFKWRYR